MNILFQCKQLKPLGEKTCKELWQTSKVIDVEASKYIWTNGQEVDAVYVLLEGAVYFSEIDESGTETVFYPQYSVNLFGESEIFLDLASYNNYARTISKSKIAVLDKAHFIQQLEANPAYTRWWLIEMTQRVQFIKKLRMATTQNSPEDRVIQSLIEAYQYSREGEEECVFPYTQEIYANILGLSRRVVNRVLNDLESRGYLSLEYGKVVIKESIFELRKR
jgi:CRP-like cAMP-binding protein